MEPRVRVDRLIESVEALGRIGAYTDPATGLVGVNRLALTEADGAGRRQVKAWLEAAGLAVRVDRIGNVYGRRRARRPELAPVLMGSHIDSVPTGGRYDGALGVLGGLEVVRALDDARVETERPIEVAFFTDEEGARFGTDMLGSAVAAGRIPLERALGLRDPDGISVGEALDAIGFRGEAEPRLTPPHAYVELHIEQGPILAAGGYELGLVTGVQAIAWREVTITGKSAHAGTTPMGLRRDPMHLIARLQGKLLELIASGRFGAELRATIGRVELHPNRVNIVPARAVVTVDLRNPDDSAMTAAEAELERFLAEAAASLGLAAEVRVTAKTRAVPFSPRVMEVVEARLVAHGHRYRPIQSGAGHDAQEMAALCPAGMIFVPGEHDGISHNPREYSTPEACGRGAQVLLETALELSR